MMVKMSDLFRSVNDLPKKIIYGLRFKQILKKITMIELFLELMQVLMQ